jgi:hypothetical protein
VAGLRFGPMTRDDLWVRLSLVWVFIMLAVFVYVVFA